MRLLAILTALIPVAAAAADLPVQPITKAPVASGSYSAFYIIGAVGAGASSQQNELTFPGIAVVGTPKQWPTGFLADAGVGVEANTPIGKVQLEIHGNYDFTVASIGCMPGIGCIGHSRNSWLLQEMVYYSPIAAPLSFTGWAWTNQVGIYGGVGAAQRVLNVCLANLGPGQTCDSAWLTGFDVGAKLEIPLSSLVKVRATYDFADYGSRITGMNSPVFVNQFVAQKEHLFKLGLDFHLP